MTQSAEISALVLRCQREGMVEGKDQVGPDWMHDGMKLAIGLDLVPRVPNVPRQRDSR